MDKIRAHVAKIIDIMSGIGMAVTFLVMLVTAVDTLLRKTIHVAVLGSLEITEVGMVILVFFGIAANQISKGHVSVDMFVDKLPRIPRLAVDTTILTVEAIVMGMMTYCGYLLTLSYLHTELATSVLGLPVWPFSIIMTLGLFLFTMLLLLDAIITGMAISKKGMANGR